MLPPNDPANYMFAMNPGIGNSFNDIPAEAMGACSESSKTCTPAVLHALQSLCVPPSACLSVSHDTSSSVSGSGTGNYTGTPTQFTPGVSQSRKIDDVLTTNRGVVDLVSKVLLCPCSATPSVQLLLVTICDRLAAWYRAMLRVDGSDPSARGPTPGFSRSDDESEHIVAQPITMGYFAVDPAMSLRIRDQLVTEEMRRVEGVVRQFAARVQDTRGQNPSAQAQKIYDILNGLLGEQLQAQATITRRQTGAQ